MKPTLRGPDKEDKNKKREQAGRQARWSIGFFLTSMLFLWVFQELVLAPWVNRTSEITYSDFKKKLADRQITDITIGERRIEGVMKDRKADGSISTTPFNTVYVAQSDPRNC